MYKDLGGNGNIKQPNKSELIKANKTCTYLGTCWKCGELCHLTKECNDTPMSMDQSSSIQNKLAVNSLKKAQSGSLILQIYAQRVFKTPQRYLTTISPVRSQLLTQQITADFQLSQEEKNNWSNQMSLVVRG